MWKNLKQFLWQERGLLITTPSVAAIVILLRVTGLLQSLELNSLDLLFRLRPQEPKDERIVIVSFDENDVRKYNDPMSDQSLAKLIEKIKSQKPKAIGLDFYRDLPVPPGQADLVKVFQTTPNLIGIEKVDEENPSLAVAPSPILKKLGQVGFNNNVVDTDDKLRRGLLFMSTKQGQMSAFSLQLAGIYITSQNIFPQPSKEANSQVFSWGKAVFAPFSPNEGGYWKADNGGYQFILNYRGSSGKSFPTISVSDVLAGNIPPGLMRDHIVLIGATATSLNDFFYTPYSSHNRTSPERTAGVEIQANIISHILSAVLDGRSGIRTWTELVQWLWILSWAGIGATLSWKVRYIGGVNFLSLQKFISLVLAVIALFGITYTAWLWGWWLPVVAPFLALGGSVLGITAYTARTAGEIRKAFGRYLTDEVVANLLESPEGLKMGGERRQITILTSDLRGFTATSERLPAEEVVRILNFYFEYMADVITHYQGTIDEFMGDGILVLFGAPTQRSDDATRAVACAVAMQLAIGEVNKKIKEWELPPLEMGIGINTGEVVVGNIGSEKRTKYGVVGNHVNLTYRIESYTVGGQIMIAQSTLNEINPSIVKIIGEKTVEPKGVKQPITIYEIGGIAGEYNLFLNKEEEVFLPLPEPILVEYKILEDKHCVDTTFKGKLVQLSLKGALICCTEPLPSGQRNRTEQSDSPIPQALSNLKLNLLIDSPDEDIYAKVSERQAAAESFYINFTCTSQGLTHLCQKTFN